MPSEPAVKRVITFIDGQNLYHAVKAAFGYPYPNYDVVKLAHAVAVQQGWLDAGVQFYTGVPEASDHDFWNAFWNSKLAAMGTRGVHVFRRALRYRNQTVRLPDGQTHTFLVGQEKGIDIRLALDIVHATRTNQCDVALVFSQDQDLSEVAEEVRAIACEQDRWFKMASAFPVSPTTRNRRGINKTDWLTVNRDMYDKCVDPTDYRPRS